jgi:hypothetical protein
MLAEERQAGQAKRDEWILRRLIWTFLETAQSEDHGPFLRTAIFRALPDLFLRLGNCHCGKSEKGRVRIYPQVV